MRCDRDHMDDTDHNTDHNTGRFTLRQRENAVA